MSETSNTVVDPSGLPTLPLPTGVTSRFVDTSPVSLKFHILESIPTQIPSDTRPPLILLVHGFPNLAFDWRYILPKLASTGYYAVAYDQRGFGRSHNADLTPIHDSTFRPSSLVRDLVTLVHALGYTSVHTLVGHDFGASTSSITTIMRPDFVKSLVLMSHPFKALPPLQYATSSAPGLPLPLQLSKNPSEALKDPNVQESLLKLDPPRKHYKWYYCTPPANDEMTYPTGQPLHDFLRGYFHLKSADYSLNSPHALKSWTAPELGIMPHYYIMLAAHGMRENVALDMSKEPDSVRAKLATTPWLNDSELAVYVAEWSRNTFRGGLNWYKMFTDPDVLKEMQPFAGTKLSVPTVFVSGEKDWGNFQEPGAIEDMEDGRSVKPGCYRKSVFIPGAGHWVNMEKPDDCVREILKIAASVAV